MKSLLDNETIAALDNMAKPLRDKLVNSQNKVSDTIIILEKLQIKIGGVK